MIASLQALYEHADIANIQSALLHSASWTQGGFSGYGEAQLTQLWMNWFAQCGLTKVQIVAQIDAHQHSVVLASLESQHAKNSIFCGFIMQHNEVSVKSVEVIADSAQLALALGQSSHQFSQWWPNPDPLFLSDYDQQIHPETVHIRPSDLLPAEHKNIELYDAWWAVWQQHHLANIAGHYQADALVYSSFSCAENALLQRINFMFQFSRPYAQLIDIYHMPSKPDELAIKWQFEGDIKSYNGVQRVRLPVFTWLNSEQDKIVSEHNLVDLIAFEKQFPKVQLAHT